MSSVDAAWLGMEDPTNLMMVTGVLALDGNVDLKRLRALLDKRLAPFGRFHQRVVRPRLRAGILHWQDDPHFDIGNHVSHIALPTPGGDKALRDLVSELMSTALDTTKPLWHVHLIDGHDRGSVVLARIHHSIADGIALVRVMLSLTDPSPTAAPPRRRSDHANDARPIDWLPAAIGRGVAAGQHLLDNPSRIADVARLSAQGAYRLGRLIVLPPDPATAFKGRRGRRKRAAWATPIPLEDFKAIGTAFGATVNDVLVATATGALRRYLERRGEPTVGLSIRASVPVNLRPAADAHKLGNSFGLVFLTLPVGVVDPVKRLGSIKKAMDELKRSPEALVAYGVLNVMGLAPVEVERMGLRFFGSKATAVLTNVPGPREPLYLAGRKLDKVMFWVPQSGHLGLGISILSYAGGVMLGVATDEGRTASASFIDGTEHDVDVVGADPLSDLAVARARADTLHPVRVGNADQLRVGQLVVAIGNPMGFSGSVTSGVVSGLGRSLATADGNGHRRFVEDVIQTDAALNPGNSGGALADWQARLVGVNTAVAGMGLGLAVPINGTTQAILAALMRNGRVRRAFLGIAGGTRALAPAVAQRPGFKAGREAPEVVSASPASAARLRSGDLIVEVDGSAVSKAGDLQRLMVEARIGSKLSIRIVREDRLVALEVVPEELK